MSASERAAGAKSTAETAELQKDCRTTAEPISCLLPCLDPSGLASLDPGPRTGASAFPENAARNQPSRNPHKARRRMAERSGRRACGAGAVPQGRGRSRAPTRRRNGGPAMSASALAWHYTTGDKWTMIQWCGELLPATVGVRPPELPIIWFSMHQQFEPTARKALANDRGQIVRRLDPQEMRTQCGGLFRVGIDADRLLSGEALRRAERMPPKVWRALCAEGSRQGADPAQWRGIVGDALPARDLTLERMSEAGDWVPL
jgi:hypothetical protein